MTHRHVSKEFPDGPILWMNSTHEYIALWLIANPCRSQRELAEEIGYSEAWISAVIHSDLFQAQYRELCDKYQTCAVEGMAEKVNAAAGEALDLMRAKIRSKNVSEQFLLGATKTLLGAIGYGAPKVAETSSRNLHVHVDASALASAREKMANRGSSASSQLVLEDELLEVLERA